MVQDQTDKVQIITITEIIGINKTQITINAGSIVIKALDKITVKIATHETCNKTETVQINNHIDNTKEQIVKPETANLA